MSALAGAQLSRLLKRFARTAWSRKIGKRHKYYLTMGGHTVATSALTLREFVIIPMFPQPVAA